MDAWKTDARIASRGFNHAYDSYVDEGNGEDFFLELVEAALGPDTDLLDVGCGHGDLTLNLAMRARTATGIDRTAGVIELARELADERQVTNCRFEHAELAGPDEDRTGGPLPLNDQSVNLVIDRRGPAIERFIDDLRRVARPRTLVLGIHPGGGPPSPPWADAVPTFQHRFGAIPADTVASWVTEPAERRALDDYRIWWIDVREHLPNVRALYDMLKFDGAPPLEKVTAELDSVFQRHAGDQGVVLRHQRLVFSLRLP